MTADPRGPMATLALMAEIGAGPAERALRARSHEELVELVMASLSVFLLLSSGSVVDAAAVLRRLDVPATPVSGGPQ